MNKKVSGFIIFAILLMVTGFGFGKSKDDAMKELGQMNIQYNEDSFIDAIAKDNTVVVKLLLDAGMNPNMVFNHNHKDLESKDLTPFALSIMLNKTDMANLIIECGADVTYQWSPSQGDKTSALLFSIMTLNYDITKIILKKGASTKFSIAGENVEALTIINQIIIDKEYFPFLPDKQMIKMDKNALDRANKIKQLLENKK